MLNTKQPDPRNVALPKKVQIEPVGQCNLRCRMCVIRFRREVPSAFMRMDLFRDLVDQFWGADELHLQGLGEPLLHPDFFEMVAYAANRGMRVSTSSNITALTGERAEECVRSRLTWIGVSIDGAVAETYESIRIGSRLEQVLANLEVLKKTKEKSGSAIPRLFLVMVVMKRNIHELKDVVQLAHDCGMEQVFVQHLRSDLLHNALPGQCQSMREFIESESLLRKNRSTIQPHFNDALALAGKLKVELRLPPINLQQYAMPAQGRKRCDWPWRSAYLTYDGKAMPCCMIALPERMTLGDAARSGFPAIWNSEGYREFRARLASSDPPSICRTCSVYRGTI